LTPHKRNPKRRQRLGPKAGVGYAEQRRHASDKNRSTRQAAFPSRLGINVYAGGGAIAGRPSIAALIRASAAEIAYPADDLEHDPAKRKPVFREDHAPPKNQSMIRKVEAGETAAL
jgi:hypothetical protein